MSITDEQLDSWENNATRVLQLNAPAMVKAPAERELKLIQALRSERKEYKARIQDKDEEILMLRQDNKNWNARTNEIRDKWERQRKWSAELEKFANSILTDYGHSQEFCEGDWDEYDDPTIEKCNCIIKPATEALAKKKEILGE